MSLITDRIFFEALKNDEEIAALCTDTGEAVRIFNPAAPVPDEDLDNVKLPYIVVSFDGMSNEDGTKDDRFEGDEDTVSISITIVEKTRDLLAVLSEKVRKVIPEYFEALENNEEDEELTELIPIQYKLTTGPVTYSPDKPCCFIRMNYSCLTNA